MLEGFKDTHELQCAERYKALQAGIAGLGSELKAAVDGFNAAMESRSRSIWERLWMITFAAVGLLVGLVAWLATELYNAKLGDRPEPPAITREGP